MSSRRRGGRKGKTYRLTVDGGVLSLCELFLSLQAQKSNPGNAVTPPPDSMVPFVYPRTLFLSHPFRPWTQQAEDGGNIRLDHSLTIVLPRLSDSFERALIKSQRSLERLCDSLSSSIILIGYATAAYLLVGGLARLVESTRIKRIGRRPGEDV